MQQEPTTPTLFGFPLNRVVAFLGPQISLVAGYIATWIVEHFEFLHLDAKGTTGAVINVIVFVLSAGLTWLGQHKWLDGWQKWEQAVASPAAPGDTVDPEADVPHAVTAGEVDAPPLEVAPEPDDEPVPEGDVGKFGDSR